MTSLRVAGPIVISPKGLGLESLPGESIADFLKLEKDKINLETTGWIRKINRLPYSTKLACIAIGHSLQKVGTNIEPNRISKDSQTGIIVATSFSNLIPIIEMHQDLITYGVNKINPSLFPNTVLNSISGYASILFGCVGPNITISQGTLSGRKALEYGTDLINKGIVNRVVVCEMNLKIPAIFKRMINDQIKVESVTSLVLQSSGEGISLEKSETYELKENEIPYALLNLAYQIKKQEHLI